MEWRALGLIVGLAALAGALLYAPFFIWFRMRARRSASKGKAPAIQYTALGWCFLFVGLVVLFAGLATGTLAPTSWLGAQVQTPLGAIGYWFCVWIAFSVVEWALRRIGVPLVRLPASTSPSALADPAAPASGSAVSSE